jgi:organic radical activating enzyme
VKKGSKSWTRLAGSATKKVRVYNLEVAGFHTYVAGGKVVHNCDTDFTSNRRHWDMEQLLGACIAEGAPDLVVLTGGEPMRQNLVPLCQLLVEAGKTVQIETAGSYWPVGEDDGKLLKALIDVGFKGHRVHIVVSPKTPRVHPMVEVYAVAWKYIITNQDPGDRIDGLPICSTQDKHRETPVVLARPPGGLLRHAVYVQPCDTQDPIANQAAQRKCVALAMRHGYRVSLQQHKILELP